MRQSTRAATIARRLVLLLACAVLASWGVAAAPASAGYFRPTVPITGTSVSLESETQITVKANPDPLPDPL